MRNLHIVYLSAIIILLVFVFFQRLYYKMKLEEQRPILNLKTFEAVVRDQLKTYGEELSEVIVRTCLATAHALKAEVVIHKEMHEEMDECSAYVKRTRPRIAKADADFKRETAHRQKTHDTHVKMFQENIDADNARIKAIRDLHRLI